ncbi:hypothetical protein [Paenibacillus sp.]|uniref:hypothetical protein n=1 Tax=Paenibacillus sp. TaxID=58172 RepID=UPI002D44B0D9|nr:hypothetical protein [Paenibacillus sp.]HZG56756.1 hypothetical protein [Paenibacillus sp.]
MHHPYVEEMKAREERERLEAAARRAWMTAEAPRRGTALRRTASGWSWCLKLRAFRICVSFRRGEMSGR